jgi:hypothetical protein
MINIYKRRKSLKASQQFRYYKAQKEVIDSPVIGGMNYVN